MRYRARSQYQRKTDFCPRDFLGLVVRPTKGWDVLEGVFSLKQRNGLMNRCSHEVERFYREGETIRLCSRTGSTKPSPMQHGIVSAHHSVVHVRQITINSKNQVNIVDRAGRRKEGNRCAQLSIAHKIGYRSEKGHEQCANSRKLKRTQHKKETQPH